MQFPRTLLISVSLIVVWITIVTIKGPYYYKEEIQRTRYAREILFNIQNVCLQTGKPKLRILDVGSGEGQIADYLESFGHEIIRIDIVDKHPKTQLYDGYNIPYLDKHYDLCLCCFVLHHTYHSSQLITEMARVSRFVCILEDALDKSYCPCISKALTKMHYLYFDQHCDMISEMKSSQEWRSLFKKHNMKLVSENDLPPSIIYYVPHVVFLLESL
jgi:ubiquinone/menaquinone biosynthesis C-methylase UbiE